MTRVIAVANQKGGVGKTTTTLNVGIALAQRQKRVLLVDLDPQGTLSLAMGIDGFGLQETVYTALTAPDFSINRIVYPVKAYLDLIPANIDLALAEMELIAEIRREWRLRQALDPLQAWYDLILIDCPPSLGLLTINALCASSKVLVPVQCERVAMRGMRLLIEILDKVTDRLNPELELGGILPTLYSPESAPAGAVLEEIRSTFGEKVYDVVIDRSPRYSEAMVAGQSLMEYAPSQAEAEAYRKLATLITDQD